MTTAFERTRDGVDDLVLRLKGLVLVRDLLGTRGASQSELDEHTAEINRVRDQLARVMREAGA
jgi:hypothetical protein